MAARRLLLLIAALTALVLASAASPPAASAAPAADDTYVYDATASVSAVGTTLTANVTVMTSALRTRGPGFQERVVLLARSFGATEGGTEIVNRYMSQAELDATQETGLVRDGRAGTHFVTNDSYSTAAEAQSRLPLPTEPDVVAQLEVPTGAFSEPSVVEPANGFPGGGTERVGSGQVPARVVGFTRLG